MATRLALRRAPRALAVVLAAWTCAACASKPTMHVNHAQISGFNATTFPPSVVMTVVMDVFNPNGYDVAIRAMHGNVLMAGKYTLPVDFRPPGDGLWLPAGKTTQVYTPVAIPLNIALSLVGEAIAQPTISYRLTGKADVTGTRTFKVE